MPPTCLSRASHVPPSTPLPLRCSHAAASPRFSALRPQLPVWTFWVVFTEMLLSIRLLHEGTLVPALRRIVAVLDEATPNMLALLFVLVPLATLTSLMHSQLFGLFDDGFSDPFVSLARIINMLTAPPPQANTEGEIFTAQEGGSEVRSSQEYRRSAEEERNALTRPPKRPTTGSAL